jgi:hypothetical protein
LRSSRACLLAGCVLGMGACCTSGQFSYERPILNDLESLQSAQAAYSSVAGGWYGTPACLGAPWDCLQGYPADGPAFVPPALATLTPENGYARSFYKDRPTNPMAVPGPFGQTYAAWAYTAVPQKERGKRRSFCADSTGRICAYKGPMPEPIRAQCSSPCERLR